MKKTSLLLGLLNFFYWFANGLLSPLIPAFALQIGASVGFVTIILAAQTLPSFLLAIPIGSGVDRYGSRLIVLCGSVVAAIAISILFFASNPYVLLISQALSGLGFMSIWIGVQSWMIAPSLHSNGKGDIKRRIANVSLAGIAGQLLGPLTGGIAASALGFRYAFAMILVSLLGCLLLSGPVGKLLAQAPPAGRVATSNFVASVRRSYRNSWQMVKQPGVLLTMSVSFSALYLMAIQNGILPLYFAYNNIDVSVIGAIASVYGIFSLLSRFFVLPLLNRLKNGTTVFLLIIPGALAVNAVFLVEGIVAYFILAACSGLVLGAAQPISLSLVAEYTAEKSRGLGVGLRMVANRAAQSLSPMNFGLLVSLAGFSIAFGASAILMCALGSFVAFKLNRLRY